MIAHCVPLLICMHSNVSTTKTCTVSTISTPKVPASFQFHQVKRSHTLSNWDAIQDAFCTGTRRTCSSQSSAEMQRKSRQRKKQIHKNCPCSNVHMNRDDIPSYTPSMSHPEASLPNGLFEEFRCCWATIRIFYSESIMKDHEGLPSSFQCLLWSQHFFVASCPVPVAHRDIRARCKPQGQQWTDMFLNSNFNAEPMHTQEDSRKEDTIR